MNVLKLQATQPLPNVLLDGKKMPFFCSGPVFSLMQQHIHHQTDLPHRHLIALIKYSTPRVLMCFSFSQCYLITGNSCDDLHINYYICNYPASLGQLHTHRHMHKRASFFTDEVNPFNYILTTWVVFSYLFFILSILFFRFCFMFNSFDNFFLVYIYLVDIFCCIFCLTQFWFKYILVLWTFRYFRKPVMSDVSVAAANQATKISKTHVKKISWCSLSLISRREVRPQKRRGHTQEGSLPLFMYISSFVYQSVKEPKREKNQMDSNGSQKSVGKNSNPKL